MQTGSSFVHTSQLASSPHDPLISLASHAIREAFGPTVQLIADVLQSRGPPGTSLHNLITHLKAKCPPPQKRLGLPIGEQPTDPPSVRASLLVLMQHGIVTAEPDHNQSQKEREAIAALLGRKIKKKAPPVIYRYHPERARYLLRYAKYIDFMKKAVDETAAALVQTLLVAGRMRTCDAIVTASTDGAVRAAAKVASAAEKTASENGGGVVTSTAAVGKKAKNISDELMAKQQVVETLYKLVTQGFIHVVKHLGKVEEDEDEGEYEFEAKEPPKKKPKISESKDISEHKNEDPIVMSLLFGNAHYKSTLPIDSVWTVNIAMFHDYLRAYNIGRLVAERFGSRVQSCGSLITAALKYRAMQQYVTAPREQLAVAASPQLTTFTPNDLIKFLPKPVVQLMEKKVGGLQRNLQKAWEDLSELNMHPIVVRRLGNNSDCFEVATNNLVDYLQERLVHQLILDRHGEMAARVISIFNKHKFLESEHLADHAMMPAKDIREVLHQLYRSRYVDLIPVSSSKQHNPSHCVFLWGIDKKRLRLQVAENITLALWNVRLRRQHELEIGKEWVERAQQATDTDENDHETDRLNYQKFCHGLERLDNAALQLDDALMAMKDF